MRHEQEVDTYSVVQATPSEIQNYLYPAWNEIDWQSQEVDEKGRVLAILRSGSQYHAEAQTMRFQSGLINAQIAGSLDEAVALRDEWRDLFDSYYRGVDVGN